MCLYVSVFWCWLSHQSITNWWIEERIEPINPSTVHVLISGAYSLTVKYNDPTKGVTAKHYRIRNLDNGGFYISTRITFNALEKLVAHYMSKIYFSHWGTLIRNSHLNPGISSLPLHYLDLTNSIERYLKIQTVTSQPCRSSWGGLNIDMGHQFWVTWKFKRVLRNPSGEAGEA